MWSRVERFIIHFVAAVYKPFEKAAKMKQEDGQPASSGGCPFSSPEVASVMR